MSKSKKTGYDVGQHVKRGPRKPNPFHPKTGVLKIDDSIKMNSEVSTAITKFKAVFVNTQLHRKLYSRIDYMRLLGIKNKGGPQWAMRCLAPSYFGKSTVAEMYTNDVNSKIAPDREKRPVVYVPLQNSSTPKKIVERVLECFGDAACKSGTETVLKRRLKRIFSHYDVELLIIDEIHHVVSWRTSRDIIDFLKSFLTEGICAVVFIGTNAAEKILSSDDELVNRVPEIADISPLGFSPGESKIMRRFLEEMDSRLISLNIFTEKSEFTEEDCATAIHRCSKGVFGVAANILRASLGVALRRHASRIEHYDLFEGIEVWSMSQKTPPTNPFVEA